MRLLRRQTVIILDPMNFANRRFLVIISSLCLHTASGYAAAETTVNPLYETSFELESVGPYKSSGGSGAVWSAKGAEIINQFAKSGKQSLRILGGKDQWVKLTLSGKISMAKGISFWAERWSSAGTFALKVEAVVDGKRTELTNLDNVIEVGARFRSHIVLAFPAGREVSEIMMTLTSPDGKGMLIDDVILLSDKPQKVTKAPVVLPLPSERLKLLADTQVFVAGKDDTHTYRIPSIITAMNGDLIAACDARRDNAGDLIHFGSRNIDIVVKRSTDNGKTWGPMETVADYPKGEGGTDPSMVLDRTTGDIFMFYSYIEKKPSKEFLFKVHRSQDNGKTWSKPRDITKDISKREWKNAFKFISSGRGSQMENGTLIHNYVLLGKGVKIFGSSDHGNSWKLMDAEIKPADESRVLELADGRLMVNSRVGGGLRWVHRSSDMGKTWSGQKEYQLPDPRCNGAILRYTSKKNGYQKNRLLFCNAGSKNGRKNLAVRISYDEGLTWSAGKVIDPGPSAYSEITILQDGTIGVFYEPGYKSLRFVRFALEDLTDGKDKLSKPYKIR